MPFWNAQDRLRPAQSEDNLIELESVKQVFTADMKVTAKTSTKTKEANELFKGGKAGPKVHITVPYLINANPVKRGKTLVAPLVQGVVHRGLG